MDSQGDADAGPLRRCVVSRAQKPTEEMIRFVAGPDRVITPDLARRLPGRGVWVEGTRAAVAEAIRRNAFARSLQQDVSVPPDLPALVDRLMQRRVAEAISLANKAGLMVAGFAKVEELIEAGRAVLLIHAAEGSADGKDKLNRKFKALGVHVDRSEAIFGELGADHLSLAMGRPNVIHAAAAEGGNSRRLIEEARRLRRYRQGGAPHGRSPATTEATQEVHD